jgi:bifunctional non-homologous end joining protein LigD
VPLTDYQRKRNFKRTSEPSGGGRGRRSGKPRFVIQKHDARALHYDFRLEAGGVLKVVGGSQGPLDRPA